MKLKTRTSIVLLVVAVLLAVSQTAEAARQRARTVKSVGNIVLIGDDIVAGTGLQDPQDSFAARFKLATQTENLLPVDLYDFSRAGDTADSVVLRMKEILAVRPDFAVIAIGFNDAMAKTDTDVFYNSMDSLMNDLYNAGVFAVVVGMPAPPQLDDAYEVEFNRVFPKIAERYSAYYLPDIMDGIMGDRHKTQLDMLRPNKESVDIMLKRFLPTMRKMIKSYQDNKSRCRHNSVNPECVQAAQSAASQAGAAVAAPAVAAPVEAAPAALPVPAQ